MMIRAAAGMTVTMGSLAFVPNVYWLLIMRFFTGILSGYIPNATALIASLTSLIMKFAMAIGGAVPGFVLSFTGYAANQSQSSTAEKGILFVTFVIPLILYVVTIAVFSSGFKSNKIKSLHVQKRKTMN